jgi:hypothetical protein
MKILAFTAAVALAGAFSVSIAQKTTPSSVHYLPMSTSIFAAADKLPACIYCYAGDPFDPCPTIPINPPCRDGGGGTVNPK